MSPADAHQSLIDASCKLVFLRSLLPKLKAKGHRVLLFSQFVIALNVIEDFCVGEGYKVLRLDGTTSQDQRQRDIDAFNAPDSEHFLYLISTRAGGMGINLATADTVIVHDLDFNPHQDLQAIARAYRYGQKKKVLVIRLMTKPSVEERMMQIAKQKLVLDHMIVQTKSTDQSNNMSSVLLDGARAIVDDKAYEDIFYDNQAIDDLIVNLETGEEEKQEDNSGFSFAPVFDNKKGKLQALDDGTSTPDANDQDPDFWSNVVKRTNEERMLKEMETHGRGKRRTQLIHPEVAEGLSTAVNDDGSPAIVIDDGTDGSEFALDDEEDETPLTPASLGSDARELMQTVKKWSKKSAKLALRPTLVPEPQSHPPHSRRLSASGILIKRRGDPIQLAFYHLNRLYCLMESMAIDGSREKQSFQDMFDPQSSGPHRMNLYMSLANRVDEKFQLQGQPRICGARKTLFEVNPLLNAYLPVPAELLTRADQNKAAFGNESHTQPLNGQTIIDVDQSAEPVQLVTGQQSSATTLDRADTAQQVTIPEPAQPASRQAFASAPERAVTLQQVPTPPHDQPITGQQTANATLVEQVKVPGPQSNDNMLRAAIQPPTQEIVMFNGRPHVYTPISQRQQPDGGSQRAPNSINGNASARRLQPETSTSTSNMELHPSHTQSGRSQVQQAQLHQGRSQRERGQHAQAQPLQPHNVNGQYVHQPQHGHGQHAHQPQHGHGQHVQPQHGHGQHAQPQHGHGQHAQPQHGREQQPQVRYIQPQQGLGQQQIHPQHVQSPPLQSNPHSEAFSRLLKTAQSSGMPFQTQPRRLDGHAQATRDQSSPSNPYGSAMSTPHPMTQGTTSYLTDELQDRYAYNDPSRRGVSQNNHTGNTIYSPHVRPSLNRQHHHSQQGLPHVLAISQSATLSPNVVGPATGGPSQQTMCQFCRSPEVVQGKCFQCARGIENEIRCHRIMEDDSPAEAQTKIEYVHTLRALARRLLKEGRT